MASTGNKRESSEFMLETYRDLSQNVMHIEGQLFNHMSFFLTLFIGILTAAGAVVQLTKQINQTVSPSETLGIFALPFLFLCLVGQFEVEMVMQLRVRKMKFIEGIAKVREYFINNDANLTSYIVLPAKLEKAPPYLRIKSDDWYKLTFLISSDALSLAFFWVGLPMLVKLFLPNAPLINIPPTIWLIISLLFWVFWLLMGLIFVITYWVIRYNYMMSYCSAYDKQRETLMGKASEYDLLYVPISKSWLKRSLGDWFLVLGK